MSTAEQIQTIEQLEEEFSAILTPAEEMPEGENPVDLQVLDDYEFNEVQASAVIYKVRESEAKVDFLKGEIKRLQSKQIALDNRLQEFKQHISRIFQHEGINKLQTAKGTLYLRKSASVEVQDLDRIPADYVRTKVSFEPNKPNIKKALQDGVKVEGCELQEREILCIK